MRHKFKYATNLQQVQELVDNVKKTGYCSFDLETNGKPYYEDDSFITIFGISFQPGSSVVIPIQHNESKIRNKPKRIKAIFELLRRELFENPDIVKIAFNIQFEYQWLKKYGINIYGRIFDAMLAKYLLNEERPNDLGYISGLLFPAFAGFKDETEKLAKKHGWAGIPLDTLSERNALDTDLTLRLMFYFEPKLIKLGLYQLFRNLLMMGARNLAESSYYGVNINHGYVCELDKKYTTDLKNLEEKMLNLPRFKRYFQKRIKRIKRGLIESLQAEIEDLYKEERKTGKNVARMVAGREKKIQNYIQGIFTTKKESKLIEKFNIKSDKMLRDFFFHSKSGLRLPIVAYTKNKKTKQETNSPSVAEDTLLLLKSSDKSGFIDELLKFNKLEHLHSTFVKGTLERISTKSKMHTSYLIHGTVTGRLSSKNPNLQQVPRVTTNPDIKKMFIPSKGKLILEVDYSQAELRLVAELAKEDVMIDIFKRGYNIHVATACKTNGCLDRYEEIKKILKDENHPDWLFWEKEKKRAKLINFGILYGQTAKKLSVELSNALGRKVSFAEADKFIEGWYKQFPKIKRWISKQHRTAREEGYVTNLFGRRRRLPNAQMSEAEAKQSGLFGFWLEALRQSVNAPIQGASSDLTQFASVLIREKILRGELPKNMRQIYTVHDSIGYEINPTDIHWVVPIIIEICANPETKKWFNFELKHVNMKVSPEIGINWGSLEEYESGKDYSLLLKAV
mgnify:CR=1 FL=1